MQTRDQQLALAVYQRVLELEAHYPQPKPRKQYGSMAHKLPILIRTAGLSQALAFVEARHKEHSPQRKLLEDLTSVLKQPKLVARSREAHFDEYMRLTQQSLDALLWFKRYAQSVLGVQPGEDVDEEGDDASTK